MNEGCQFVGGRLGKSTYASAVAESVDNMFVKIFTPSV